MKFIKFLSLLSVFILFGQINCAAKLEGQAKMADQQKLVFDPALVLGNFQRTVGFDIISHNFKKVFEMAIDLMDSYSKMNISLEHKLEIITELSLLFTKYKDNLVKLIDVNSPKLFEFVLKCAQKKDNVFEEAFTAYVERCLKDQNIRVACRNVIKIINNIYKFELHTIYQDILYKLYRYLENNVKVLEELVKANNQEVIAFLAWGFDDEIINMDRILHVKPDNITRDNFTERAISISPLTTDDALFSIED